MQTPTNNRRWQIAQQINQIHLTDPGGVEEKLGCATGHVNESKMKTKGSAIKVACRMDRPNADDRT